MEVIYQIFNWALLGCYNICKNYGWAIILFTLLSKIVLLPVSIWVQKNSIKIIQMQPEINFLTAKHFGDSDAIAEGTNAIYKKYKYNPLASVIPLIIQLVILMGLIEVIKRGMNNSAIDTIFYGINLGIVPSEVGKLYILSPIIAGLSAWVMCACQNASNVLQAEQSNMNKYSMMVISVGLSLYLGWLVPIGVAVYWVASNLFSTVQLYILNYFINPKDYVNYEELEKSRVALNELKSVGKDKKKRKLFGDPEAKREKQDYKKFFSIVNKKLVFYSEGSGFYKYYKGIIEYILEHTNIVIHYITSDINDKIFDMADTNPQIKAYYIGDKKLITLMMKMDADVVVMTTPDLETYHIKRSYVRKDIEYIFIMHDMGSFNLTNRKGAVDHFDTVFCTGKNQKEEVEKIEVAYNLPKKTTLEAGYPLLDDMIKDYEGGKLTTDNSANDKRPVVLIGPSWQVDSIMDSCVEEILDAFKDKEFDVIVRPHPQYVRHKAEKCEALKDKYADDPHVIIQTDFSSNSTVFDAAILVTDWSGICFEYAYTTKRPVIFIDTPMKIMNPEYQKIDTVPINIMLRNEIGKSLALDEVSSIYDVAKEMINNKDKYYDKINAFTNEYVYNLGHSAEVEAKYIIGQLQKKAKERKANQ